MKEELINELQGQAVGLIEKIQKSPLFDNDEVAYLAKLVLYATEKAIEVANAGAAA
jgi:hypothetical protein